MCFLNWSNYTPGIDTVYNVPPKASARVCFVFQKSHLDAVEYVIKFPPFSPSPSSKEKEQGLSTWDFYYRPPTKLREGNVFRDVCLSTGEGVGMPGPRSLLGGIPRGDGRVYQVYPRYWHLVIATEAGGMHSTGMLSCLTDKHPMESSLQTDPVVVSQAAKTMQLAFCNITIMKKSFTCFFKDSVKSV